VASGASGSGDGSVTVRISSNAESARTGTLTVASQTITIEQAAAAPAPCTYRLSESTRSVDSEAQDVRVSMNAPSACTWTVSSNAPWISVADAGPGSGNGSFRLAVAANSGDARTGTVRVASETLTIQQSAACSYSIKPTFYNAGRGPDTITINVTAGSGCPWTTRNDASWVTVEAGSSGSGNGVVRLSVPANNAGERSTVLTIAGQPFTLHQDGSCTYDIKPGFYNAGRGPDDIKIDVMTDPGCAWTASSSVDWVTVDEGASGTGKGRVRLRVEPNNGAPRSVVLTIAGQPFELRQSGRD